MRLSTRVEPFDFGTRHASASREWDELVSKPRRKQRPDSSNDRILNEVRLAHLSVDSSQNSPHSPSKWHVLSGWDALFGIGLFAISVFVLHATMRRDESDDVSKLPPGKISERGPPPPPPCRDPDLKGIAKRRKPKAGLPKRGRVS